MPEVCHPLISGGMTKFVPNVEFDRKYIESHCNEEYLSIGEQLYKIIDVKEYYVEGKSLAVFLDIGNAD